MERIFKNTELKPKREAQSLKPEEAKAASGLGLQALGFRLWASGFGLQALGSGLQA